MALQIPGLDEDKQDANNFLRFLIMHELSKDQSRLNFINKSL